ncbi:MAG: hypothetical protein ABI440_02315 [Casimicrobiaceae bacterium]
MARLHRLLCAALVIAAALCATRADAAGPPTCNSPFVDVPDAASYCDAAVWLKNRNITLGCTDATHYCPDDVVTRASMALFLNRLATVLAPDFLHQSQTFSTGIGASVYCQTSPYAVTGYNRVATGDASAYYFSGGSQVATRLVYSFDGGSTWSSWAALSMPVNVGTPFSTASSTSPQVPIGVGSSVTFGVQVDPGGVPVSGGCEMRVRIDNFNFGVVG